MIQSIGVVKTGNILKEEESIAKKLRAHIKL